MSNGAGGSVRPGGLLSGHPERGACRCPCPEDVIPPVAFETPPSPDPAPGGSGGRPGRHSPFSAHSGSFKSAFLSRSGPVAYNFIGWRATLRAWHPRRHLKSTSSTHRIATTPLRHSGARSAFPPSMGRPLRSRRTSTATTRSPRRPIPICLKRSSDRSAMPAPGRSGSGSGAGWGRPARCWRTGAPSTWRPGRERR